MNFKGKSTIQLFNAKTGKETGRFVDENMMTNALTQVFNPPEWILLWGGGVDENVSNYGIDHTNCFNFVARQWTPVATRMLGGVFLFRDKIPENANTVMMPYNNQMVGNAGPATTAYSASTMGTYNQNESGEIDYGYRHVWDFATDRSNGQISCLSLTSVGGGFFGAQYTRGANYFSAGMLPGYSPTSGSVAMNAWTIAAPYTTERSFFEKTPGQCEKELALNYTSSSGINRSTGSYRIIYAEELSNGNIKLLAYCDNQTTSRYSASPGLKELIISDPRRHMLAKPTLDVLSVRTVIQISSYDTDNIHPYVYNDQIHLVYVLNKNRFIHKIYNLNSYAQISSTEIETMAKLAVDQYGGMLYWNGNYYGLSATTHRLLQIAPDGTLLKNTGVFTYIKGVYIDENSNAAYVGSSTSSAVYYNNGNSTNNNSLGCVLRKLTQPNTGELHVDDVRFAFGDSFYVISDSVKTTNYVPTKVKGMSLPRYICGAINCCYHSSIYQGTAIIWRYGVDYTYLATINNLSAPVTKTETQTMKVTYDITEA